MGGSRGRARELGPALGPVFAAVQDAAEEAILNSVFMVTTTTGSWGTSAAPCRWTW